ncbi:MAG: Hsp70 family protein [Phycisphaera sp.]|nr:Hsp70 family protein [Phycisphaera sp.]
MTVESAQSLSSRGDAIVGIDLGTTNSLVAYCDEKGPRILPVELGGQSNNLLPSVVRYDPRSGEVVSVGQQARLHAVEFPTDTVHSVKRLMGRGIEDVKGELGYLPYEVVEGEHKTARVRVGEHVKSPQEISAVILRTLRDAAEKALGCRVRKAVVTVPAYFDDAQRQATRDAGRIAGLEVVRIVNEPTAAALAYGIGLHQSPLDTPVNTTKSRDGSVSLSTKFNPKACSENSQTGDAIAGVMGNASGGGGHTIAVFDLGGGTFDVSILRLEKTDTGMVDQVLATSGDTHLGGDDVDRLIVEYLQRRIAEQFHIEPNFPPSTRQALRNFAEAMKIRLSTEQSADIEIDLGEGRTFRGTLTRSEFEKMITPWVDRAIACCAQAIDAAGLATDGKLPGVERVVMVGGSTRIPLVRGRVKAFFQTEPYTALNPDEVVALGASVQASILMGLRSDMLLLDVIPLSLGIETMGGAVAKLIVANTTIPARATEQFTTYADGQTNVKLHVLQGERELVEHCRSLGTFELRGIPPMPAGLPKIEVTFLVDANGVLTVSAIEKRSEITAHIQVVPNHGLTRQEVADLEARSYEHAKEDMTAHRLIDLRNQARLDIRQIQRQLAKVGHELDEAQSQTITHHVALVEDFLKQPKPDPEPFHHALDAMDKATVRLAELAIKHALQD